MKRCISWLVIVLLLSSAEHTTSGQQNDSASERQDAMDALVSLLTQDYKFPVSGHNIVTGTPESEEIEDVAEISDNPCTILLKRHVVAYDSDGDVMYKENKKYVIPLGYQNENPGDFHVRVLNASYDPPSQGIVGPQGIKFGVGPDEDYAYSVLKAVKRAVTACKP
jgi:hypothetical protein